MARAKIRIFIDSPVAILARELSLAIRIRYQKIRNCSPLRVSRPNKVISSTQSFTECTRSRFSLALRA